MNVLNNKWDWFVKSKNQATPKAMECQMILFLVPSTRTRRDLILLKLVLKYFIKFRGWGDPDTYLNKIISLRHLGGNTLYQFIIQKSSI